MILPLNLSYFISKKDNNSLPGIFQEYLLNQNISNYLSEDINNLRLYLSQSKDTIDFSEHGAGSRLMKPGKRKISKIIKNSATKHYLGLFYNNLIRQFKVKKVLELGTSLGVGTAYLSGDNSSTEIISIEACKSTLNYARKNLDTLKIKKYSLINDTFDNVLNSNKLSNHKFDLIYIDGNHRGSYLTKYYQILSRDYLNSRSIIIIDDINWSADMYNSWRKMSESNRNSCILDLYRTGVIFKNYNTLPDGYFKVKITK